MSSLGSDAKSEKNVLERMNGSDLPEWYRDGNLVEYTSDKMSVFRSTCITEIPPSQLVDGKVTEQILVP